MRSLIVLGLGLVQGFRRLIMYNERPTATHLLGSWNEFRCALVLVALALPLANKSVLVAGWWKFVRLL